MKKSFLLIVLVGASCSIIFSQNITFVPKTDTVKIISGCTPPEVIFKIYAGTDSDTIKVIAGFNSYIQCEDSLGNQIDISKIVGFICSNKEQNDIYELYFHKEPKSQNILEIVPFDSAFYKDFGYNSEIKLKVIRNGIYVDSLAQKFFAKSIGLGVEDDSKSIPHNCRIMSVYPNPFNPTTKIEYEITETGFVNLSVYSSLGELIKVIEQKEKYPGKYEIVWDAESNVSGIYFIVLSTGDYSFTKKVILLK
ncbi:MAG: T9SS type A sorting domain-containing protein [Bacteroidota bacterium]